ncbi:ATP-binding protein [Clostridium sp. DJ247]|uniref:ATP-binding protein n=1 Tax=Clostridium sp. DJ247 TaxID=2726188 RepID=UPI001625BDC1|nr:ATP-binding protein [Clostridium sp. DJ247]MBC2581749.1 ATP-binding protein [Clostridium sp. DJ247]
MQNTVTPINNEVKRIKLALDSISIYRQLLEDKVINRLHTLVNYINSEDIDLGHFISLYNDFFYTLACNSNNSLKEYIVDKIIFQESPYSRIVETPEFNERKNPFEEAIRNDLVNLQLISEFTSFQIKNYIKEHVDESIFYSEIIERLPDWGIEEQCTHTGNVYANHITILKEEFYKSNDWGSCLEALDEFYKKYGCGIFSRFRAFTWDKVKEQGYLKGVETPDPTKLSDLIDYEFERSKIIENTLQFVNGFPANNMLLYGDRGTGKSSTVKAVLNEYYLQGLRMIEVPKAHLVDFPVIINSLKNKPQKFIIFIDDLAFEDTGDSYSALKAVLEGGVEGKPSNVIIYATSNRRHLVKESFSDRSGLQYGSANDELHAADNIQEKLSLADRFGITVVFTSPNKNKYLEIVDGIAEKRKLKIDKEILHAEAIKWELKYNGRSPRTARQFIDWIEGKEEFHNL